jgi:hypothetical protein
MQPQSATIRGQRGHISDRERGRDAPVFQSESFTERFPDAARINTTAFGPPHWREEELADQRRRLAHDSDVTGFWVACSGRNDAAVLSRPCHDSL